MDETGGHCAEGSSHTEAETTLRLGCSSWGVELLEAEAEAECCAGLGVQSRECCLTGWNFILEEEKVNVLKAMCLKTVKLKDHTGEAETG